MRKTAQMESRLFDEAMTAILRADPHSVKVAVDLEVQARTAKREAKGERKRGRKPRINSLSDRESSAKS